MMNFQLSFLFLAQRSLRNRGILPAFILLITADGLTFPSFLNNQLSKLTGLQKLKGSKNGAEHVAANAHTIVHIFSVDDPEKDEMYVYLIKFAGYFAENIGNDAENVVAVDFVDLALFDQPVVVVDVRADAFLYDLQLRQDLFGSQFGHEFGQFVDGVEEMSLDLQFGVDVEEGRGEDGGVVLDQLEVDGEGDAFLVDDGGEHGEEIPVVDRPDLLQDDVVDPFEVFWLFEGCVAHQPLFVGVQTAVLEIDAPLLDEKFEVFLVGLLVLWFRFGQDFFGVGLDVLCEGFVQSSEGVADAIEFLLHDLGQSFQPLLNLIFVKFDVVGLLIAVAFPAFWGYAGGLGVFVGIAIGGSLFLVNELNVQRQFAEYLLEEGLAKVDLHVFGFGFVLQA